MRWELVRWELLKSYYSPRKSTHCMVMVLKVCTCQSSSIWIVGLGIFFPNSLVVLQISGNASAHWQVKPHKSLNLNNDAWMHDSQVSRPKKKTSRYQLDTAPTSFHDLLCPLRNRSSPCISIQFVYTIYVLQDTLVGFATIELADSTATYDTNHCIVL